MEDISIMKQNIGTLAALSLLLLLQSGCAMARRGDGGNGAAIVVKELVKTGRSWDGKLLIPYPQGQPEITIRRVSIPAGTRLETHSHPMINAGVLLSGQLKVVTVDGKTLHLKAGDPIVEVVNTLHYGINEGDVPAEIVVFYAGTTDARKP